ncbi:MAG: DUF6326 family protein [Alphaproteobacteria bacterium]
MLDIKTRISTLWIIVTLNIVFADIYSIILEFGGANLLDIPGNAEIMMLIAVFLTNVPIMMIYFSRVMEVKANRRMNIGTAIVTILYVIGGASMVPHYIAAASIEVALLLYIIWTAWKWNAQSMGEHLSAPA